MNQKGAIHLLFLVVAIGLIVFIGITSVAPFRNQLLGSLFPKKSSQAAGVVDWPMSGANPQRTSATSAEAPGLLKVQWIKPLEPYVSQKVQVIAANKTLFISTSKGLYAFNSDDASEKWVFATEMPLGNAPTFDSGTVYVGGLDRKLYALDANTGQKKWEFTGAEGGYTTNPLVVNNTVYLGNRDSYFYAVDASNGNLKWKYKTGGQILQSAAYSNGVIYFGSQDASAYALNENPSNSNDPNTILKWKSAKLPGWGFRSWWPVVYQDKVIFTGSADEQGAYVNRTLDTWLYPTSYKNPNDTTSFPKGQLPGVKGNEPGNWPSGQATFDIRTNPAGKSLPDYYETYPQKRRGYVLNQSDGSEVQYDLDSDGITDAAPFTVLGGKSGNIYPPVVGADGVLYFQMINFYTGAIPGAVPVGWKIGTPFLTLPVSAAHFGTSGHLPNDEPTGLSIGGNHLYWNLCCDRFIGSANMSVANPYPIPPSNQASTRQWRHVSGGNPQPMDTGIAGLTQNYWQQNLPYIWNPNPVGNTLYHIEHGDNVGPTLYDGKMFVLRSNALFAFSPNGTGSSAPLLPLATTKTPVATPMPLTAAQLTAKLEDQIQKLIAAGHMRSGFSRSGVIDQLVEQTGFIGEDKLMHYFHSPGENISILLRALPHLSPQLQTQLKTYIQNEQALFPLQTYSHIGFTSGAQRESFNFREQPNTLYNPSTAAMGPVGGRNMDNYYALWKYAQTFGNAKQLFDSINVHAFPSAPADTDLPNKLNNRITGLTGYLELQKLAGYPEDAVKAAELANLKNVRAQQLKWDVTGNKGTWENNYYNVLITAWNFLHMMPEQADHLNQNALAKAQSVIAKYESMAPYWMQAENEEAQLENVVMPYHQQYTLFQAKARILKQSQQELVKYLDQPITPVGDMYYIDNLVAAIEAPTDPNSTPVPSVNSSPIVSALPSSLPAKLGDIDGNNKVDIFDYNQLLTNFGQTGDFVADIDRNGKVDIFDYNILLSNYGK